MRPMNCFMRSEFGELTTPSSSFSLAAAAALTPPRRPFRRFSRGPWSFARMSSAASLPRSWKMFVTSSPDWAFKAAFFSSASFFCAAFSSIARRFWFWEWALWKAATKSPRRSLKNCSTPQDLGSSPKEDTRTAKRCSVAWNRFFNVAASWSACSRKGAMTSTKRSALEAACFRRAATCCRTKAMDFSNFLKSSFHCVSGHRAASSMSGKSEDTSNKDTSRRSHQVTSQFIKDFWLSNDLTVANFAKASNLYPTTPPRLVPPFK
mmetsp:Transcript_19719/g.63395  ORF Transcript_19719/g.63395 Transcript_19719/m.63395 type:complete len:264 (+) Transcript_19719:781-1572(+)